MSASVRNIVEARAAYIDERINQAIDRSAGNFTEDEYEQWWREAHETWRNQHPNLAALLPSHLPQEQL